MVNHCVADAWSENHIGDQNLKTNFKSTHREVLRSGREEAVVEGGEGEVGDELGVGVYERYMRLTMMKRENQGKYCTLPIVLPRGIMGAFIIIPMPGIIPFCSSISASHSELG